LYPSTSETTREPLGCAAKAGDRGSQERSGRRAAIGYALALFTGQLPKLSTYRVIEARRIEIRGRPGEPLQGDGDIIGELDAAIEALPRALDLIYPPLPDSDVPSAT
jgi:hypothetical protein